MTMPDGRDLSAPDLPATDPSATDPAATDLSLVVRMDLRVVDADALAWAAQEATRAANPGMTDDELEREVGAGVEDALFAIANAVGLDALLEDTPGLEVRAVASEVAYGLEEISVEEDDDR